MQIFDKINPFLLTHFPCGSPLLGGPYHYMKQCEQYIFIISHDHTKCILCKDTTTFELSLIYSTVYMVFPRQPLLFTETVPHNAYQHTKQWRETIRSDKNFSFELLLRLKYSLGNSRHIDIIPCGNRFR